METPLEDLPLQRSTVQAFFPSEAFSALTSICVAKEFTATLAYVGIC